MRHCLTSLVIVGGLMVSGTAVGQPQVPVKANATLDKTTKEEVRKLQEKRREVLLQALEVRTKLYRDGRAEFDGVFDASKRLLAVELDLASKKAERIAAYKTYLKTAEMMVEIATAKRQAGRGTYAAVLDAQDAVLVGKIGLVKEGEKVKVKEAKK